MNTLGGHQMPDVMAEAMKPRRMSQLRVKCPHCDHQAITRTSERMTPLLREIYYQCSNIACGHVFIAALEIVRTVTPSQMPRPGVRLPTLTRGSHIPFYTGDGPANDQQQGTDDPVPRTAPG